MLWCHANDGQAVTQTAFGSRVRGRDRAAALENQIFLYRLTSPAEPTALAVGALHLSARISHLTPYVLARDLRQHLENKVFHAIHAKVTGEPNG